jgi:hypothetical protein
VQRGPLVLTLLACLACTTLRPPAGSPAAAERAPRGEIAEFAYHPLAASDVLVQPEGLTVEQNWLLDLYTLLHRRDYRVFRLVFDAEGPDDAIAHLYLPPGQERYPGVVVYPILGGTHVVSELLAKMLVRRRFAVAWLERRPLDLEGENTPEALVGALRAAVVDGRRLIDFLQQHPRVDTERIGVVGVSLGGMLALDLTAADPRVRGGFYMLTGGGLPEILYDTREEPVRAFRDRIRRTLEVETREQFVAAVAPHTRPVDPLTWADRIDPRSVMLVSGRFDRIMPPERTRALWEALGRPVWRKVPAGHYQAFPFLVASVGPAADHLDRVLGRSR